MQRTTECHIYTTKGKLIPNAVEAISRTILFLARNSVAEVARALYDTFVSSRKKTVEATIERIRRDLEEFEKEQRARIRDGDAHYERTRLPVEKEMDTLATADFPGSLHEFMSYCI